MFLVMFVLPMLTSMLSYKNWDCQNTSKRNVLFEPSRQFRMLGILLRDKVKALRSGILIFSNYVVAEFSRQLSGSISIYNFGKFIYSFYECLLSLFINSNKCQSSTPVDCSISLYRNYRLKLANNGTKIETIQPLTSILMGTISESILFSIACIYCCSVLSSKLDWLSSVKLLRMYYRLLLALRLVNTKLLILYMYLLFLNMVTKSKLSISRLSNIKESNALNCWYPNIQTILVPYIVVLKSDKDI